MVSLNWKKWWMGTPLGVHRLGPPVQSCWNLEKILRIGTSSYADSGSTGSSDDLPVDPYAQAGFHELGRYARVCFYFRCFEKSLFFYYFVWDS